MANDNKHKHMEMIQGVITRMGSNSFIIKGWSVTSIGAMYAYWLTKSNYWMLVLILGVVLLFWFHDAYYLHLERGFRNLYEEVRNKNDSQIDFGMTPIFTEKGMCSAMRPILKWSYGSITLITIVLLFIFKP
ncbi:hypothetical protein IIC_05777 [Bacillus cereus VD021]|uniref:Uncharacterized protein n=1 Tax=Bacillus cereus VD021 TaxID=1053224 RepID=R8H0E6_BACCE|nr:hypothetical protein [Bacillus cereus]EOO66318.1 hypothetical protein IIC_05777 [Bacillus cereus VD021]